MSIKIGMIIIIVIVGAIITIPIAVMLYLIDRTARVNAFLREIHKEINKLEEERYYKTLHILDKYRYEDYLYSVRALRLEEWFTEDEIEILLNEKDGKNNR